MKAVVVALVAGLLSGCIIKGGPHGHGGGPPGHGGVPPGHGGIPPGRGGGIGHVHAIGCGHFFHAGIWVPAGEIRVPSAHFCVGGCSHYCVAGSWFALDGHVHAPGCGHFLRAGIWVCD
jgi:hypothetical protein